MGAILYPAATTANPGGITPSTQNPISGVFGAGRVKFLTASQTFTVPAGVYRVRVRLWGAGSFNGTAGGTSSFGNYVSATGGAADGSVGGNGVGGDVNNQGGAFVNSGGGAASLIGPGGTTTTQARGGAGAGGFYSKNGGSGFEGFTGQGGRAETWTTNSGLWRPYAGEIGRADILDFIGTGGGGATSQMSNDSTTYAADGANGGGGGAATISPATYAGRGGFPGGGHGAGGAGGGFAMKEIDVTPGQQITVTVGATPAGNGGAGLVVVEY